MRRVAFANDALKKFVEWEAINRKIFIRISSLIEEIRRTPFSGTGKPEPLKGNLKGKWSRRIDNEHRLVYSVTEDQIVVHGDIMSSLGRILNVLQQRATASLQVMPSPFYATFKVFLR